MTSRASGRVTSTSRNVTYKNGVRGAPRGREWDSVRIIAEVIVSTPGTTPLDVRRIPNTYTAAFDLWSGTWIYAAFLFNEKIEYPQDAREKVFVRIRWVEQGACVDTLARNISVAALWDCILSSSFQ